MGRGANPSAHPPARRRPDSQGRPWSSPGSRHADDQALRSELEQFTAGRTEFPTRADFAAAWRTDLRCAVGKKGTAYWAAQLGLSLAPRQDKAPYGEVDAIHDAHQVVACHGQLPGVRGLRALGYARLASAVQAAGGARRFSALHGIGGVLDATVRASRQSQIGAKNAPSAARLPSPKGSASLT